MQTRNDGKHVILPAAAPIDRRPNRARMPVTMPRQSDGKLHRDGSGAANMQPKHPVTECGRVHGASELHANERKRIIEYRFVYHRRRKEKRRWMQSLAKYDRLRGQDKGARGAPRSGDGISTTCRTFARGALAAATSRKWQIPNDVHILMRCAGAAIPDEGPAVALREWITNDFTGAGGRPSGSRPAVRQGAAKCGRRTVALRLKLRGPIASGDLS